MKKISQMKKQLFIFFLLFSGIVSAQDVIVLHDGSTILSKVSEVGVNEVKYKKFANQEGPTYTILKSDILRINYENGDKDKFEDAQQSVRKSIIEAKPTVDNTELISRYNQVYEHGERIKDKSKQAVEGYCILGVGKNSVLTTEDVEIEIRQEPYEYGQTTMSGKPLYNIFWRYFVQVHNKTDNIIYIDLANTFRVKKNGETKSYYDTSQTTINKRSGSNVGVNLGAITGVVGIGGVAGNLANGINVGSSNSSSTSKTYSKQRIIAIPPKGRMPIEKFKRAMVKNGGSLAKNKYSLIYEGEELLYGFREGEMPNMILGEKYFFEENNSPYFVDFSITYSKDSEFKTANVIKLSVYMRELIATKFSQPWNMFGRYAGLSNEKLTEMINSIIRNYNEYTIIGTFGYSRNSGNRDIEELFE
jgi:hypothetical protein